MAAKKVKRWIKVRMPSSYKRGENSEYESVQVEAWVVKGIDDLFVNHAPMGNVGWFITHRASGLRIDFPYPFKTRPIAVKVMREIVDLADWSIKNPRKLRKRNPVLADLCYEVAKEVAGVKGMLGADARMSHHKPKPKKKKHKKASP